MTNPLDGYRDVYPWPWHWSRDIDAWPISRLTLVKALYEDLDFWTYDNHWSAFGGFGHGSELMTDIYWSDDDSPYERLQLPLDIGDHVADLLVAHEGENIRLMLWNYLVWRPVLGWQEWLGFQGNFVDHIHVEWIPEPEAS